MPQGGKPCTGIRAQYGLSWYHIFFSLSSPFRKRCMQISPNYSVSSQRKRLTNVLPCIIIIRHLRECWNGRQARLRCVWLRRVGSSPISRTRKDRIPVGYPVFSGMGGGTRKTVKKTCRGHVFRPWESPRKSNGGPHGPAGDFRNSVRPSMFPPPRTVVSGLFLVQ